MVGGPSFPRLVCGVPSVKGQQPARAEASFEVGEYVGPVGIGEEDLRDVGGHERRVEGLVGKVGGRAPDPGHSVRARLRVGDVEEGRVRVDAGDIEAGVGQHDRQPTGAAPDIDHPASLELGEGEEELVVHSPLVLAVVAGREPSVELGIGDVERGEWPPSPFWVASRRRSRRWRGRRRVGGVDVGSGLVGAERLVLGLQVVEGGIAQVPALARIRVPTPDPLAGDGLGAVQPVEPDGGADGCG